MQRLLELGLGGLFIWAAILATGHTAPPNQVPESPVPFPSYEPPAPEPSVAPGLTPCAQAIEALLDEGIAIPVDSIEACPTYDPDATGKGPVGDDSVDTDDDLDLGNEEGSLGDAITDAIEDVLARDGDLHSRNLGELAVMFSDEVPCMEGQRLHIWEDGSYGCE